MNSEFKDILTKLSGLKSVSLFQQAHAMEVIEHVSELLGGSLPPELAAFYQAGIARIGDFSAVMPTWSEHVGWRNGGVLDLLNVQAIPLFDDGCGNLFGLDLTPAADPRAVYFFDHERGYEAPEWAAGSSLARFLLYLANADKALDEGWPERWILTHDPDIERCPRAPAIWNVS